LAGGIGPAPADAAADKAARDSTEPLTIEAAQIDDIDAHVGILP
jgi:hypothetical protein